MSDQESPNLPPAEIELEELTTQIILGTLTQLDVEFEMPVDEKNVAVFQFKIGVPDLNAESFVEDWRAKKYSDVPFSQLANNGQRVATARAWVEALMVEPFPAWIERSPNLIQGPRGENYYANTATLNPDFVVQAYVGIRKVADRFHQAQLQSFTKLGGKLRPKNPSRTRQ
jgi:hypothetical protein